MIKKIILCSLLTVANCISSNTANASTPEQIVHEQYIHNYAHWWAPKMPVNKIERSTKFDKYAQPTTCIASLVLQNSNPMTIWTKKQEAQNNSQENGEKEDEEESQIPPHEEANRRASLIDLEALFLLELELFEACIALVLEEQSVTASDSDEHSTDEATFTPHISNIQTLTEVILGHALAKYKQMSNLASREGRILNSHGTHDYFGGKAVETMNAFLEECITKILSRVAAIEQENQRRVNRWQWLSPRYYWSLFTNNIYKPVARWTRRTSNNNRLDIDGLDGIL